jgi:hypothetical protein
MATKLKTVGDALDELPKPEGLALLRVPFPPHQISKLPKESKAQREARQADRSKAENCAVCGGWHHRQAVHLDYVGHAALTDRLLDADPSWSWEPVSFNEDGLPALDRNGGLWIKLTVCGVTRYGYGAADGKSGGDAVKEIIGDALRNAAMRFGAALDLWHKGDLHAEEDDAPPNPTTGEPRPKQRVKLDGPYTCPTQLMTAAREFVRTLESMGDLDEFIAWAGTSDYREFCEQLARDMPAWWDTGEGMPEEFVPLEIRIRQKREDLERAEANKSRENA